MSKDWVGATLGARKAPVQESVRASSLSRVLGEADLDRPEQAPPPEAPEPPPAPDVPEQPDVADMEIPLGFNVQSLAAAWASGDKVTVAQRVLDGLPSYTDLVSLFYGIGMEGAMDLARMMDELDSGEEVEEPAAPAAPAPEEPSLNEQ